VGWIVTDTIYYTSAKYIKIFPHSGKCELFGAEPIDKNPLQRGWGDNWGKMLERPFINVQIENVN
jgi:hypothetical protein